MPKVLVIAYYWPPAGGPGVQRWLSFVKYLPDLGVEPVLLVPDKADYPLVDTSLVADVPTGINVHKQKIWEPYRFASLIGGKKTRTISSGIIEESKRSWLYNLLLWIRGNLFIPDARKYWVKPAVRKAERLLQEEGINTIITTGPPHSVHLIGLQLKERRQVRWLADFRDPWTQIGYHGQLKLTPRSAEKHLKLERRVLQTADTILVTSRSTREAFKAITTKPIEVITNGYEDSQLQSDYKANEFRLTHVGSILSRRNPENLWQALAELLNERPEFARKFQLQLTGIVSRTVKDSILKFGLNSYLLTEEYVPHKVARERQQQASVLLLIEVDSEDNVGILPGKLFEYMSSGRPILGIGPKGWEAGDLIEETHTGAVFSYSDKAVLKDQIWKWFLLFEKGSLTLDPKGVEQYSRPRLAEKLASLI